MYVGEHPDENSPAEQRLEVGGIALDVAKTLQLVTTVALRVERLTLHSRWQPHPEAPPHWVQQFGPPLASCARAAESHNQSSGMFGQAERAVADAASGSEVAPRMSVDNGTPPGARTAIRSSNIRIADPAGMPNVIDINVGRQAISPLPLPALSLANFCLRSAIGAAAIIVAQPPGPLKEMHVTVHVAHLQLLVVEAMMSLEGAWPHRSRHTARSPAAAST